MLEYFSSCGNAAQKLMGAHEHFNNNNNNGNNSLNNPEATNVSGNEVAENVVNNVAQNMGEVVNQVLNNVVANSVNNAIRNEVNEGAVNEAVNDAVNNTVNNVKNAVDNLNNIKTNTNVAIMNNNNNVGGEMGVCEVLGIIVALIIKVLPVVLIAVNCNPKNKLLHGVLAFFFDRIYLFIHALVKYVFPVKGYCGN